MNGTQENQKLGYALNAKAHTGIKRKEKPKKIKNLKFHKKVKCAKCNVEFYASNAEIRRGGGKFCSKNCYYASRVGRVSPNWKGGRKVAPNGYIEIYKPDSPLSDSTGYVKEHRYVMSKYLGRLLDAAEIVHHIDENPENNDLSNLELMLRGPHIRLHKKGVKFSETHRKKISNYRKTLKIQRNNNGTFKKGVSYGR